jgi:hypothetical protein
MFRNLFFSDLTVDDLLLHIPKESVDYLSLIFVLSAITPIQMPSALSNISKILKPGGLVLFRDYGIYDMTQLRFVSKKDRKLGENYYVRADGTRVFYFNLEDTTNLFESCGYTLVEARYDTRELRNRKKMINMYRVWVNAVFQKK